MNNDLDLKSGIPLYMQVADRIRDGIASGRLAAGQRLPTVREMARELRINPGTVASAYEELTREGLAEARVGVGTFVRSDAGKIKQIRTLAQKKVRNHLEQAVQSASAAGLDRATLRKMLDGAAANLSKPGKHRNSA